MSRSKLIAERLKSREKFRKNAGVVIIVFTAAYLAWRLTVFSDDWLFSLLFYVSEVLSFLMIVSMICSSWNYKHRVPIPPAPDQKVDVFLPVYKEPVEMIRQTIRAAKAIRYPHHVHVLDDGKREEIRLLAEELEVQYIRRPGNKGAKAGNMNHALANAKGDFIFVFDADHLAQPEAIDAVLGFFGDRQVGQVITPQDYYNLDGLQFLHNGKGRIWHDQSRFYNLSQGCKDFCNCATSCGTGVMYRRKVIDEIGGFPELTITEDMHVSLLIHQRGYRSVYLNEAIAYGVAPADLADYYRTRERWAHGNLHVLKVEKPWTAKGLTLKQRLSYMELGIIYLECWQQLILFGIPVLSLFFAWQPFEITPLNVIIVLFFPLLMTLLHDSQGCGMSRNWTSQLFSIARMPVQFSAWAAVLGRKLSWRASRKNLSGHFDWRLVLPQLALTLVSFAALVYGLVKIPEIRFNGPVLDMFQHVWHRIVDGSSATGFLPAGGLRQVLNSGYSWDLLLISSFWTAYNGSRSFFWLVDTYQRTRNTHTHYRFHIPLLVELESGELHGTAWVSESSLRMTCPHSKYPAGANIPMTLWLPAGQLAVEAVVSHADANGFEAEFLWQGDAKHDQLCDTLFSVDWHSEIHQREGYFPTLWEQLLEMILLKPREKLLEWTPALLHTEDEETKKSFVLLGANAGETPSQLLGFGKERCGGKITVILPSREKEEFLVGDSLALQGWCRVGLDQSARWKASISLLPRPATN